jgi:hypothetical protein
MLDKSYIIKKANSLEYVSKSTVLYNGALLVACFCEDITDALIVQQLNSCDYECLLDYCSRRGYELWEVAIQPILLGRVAPSDSLIDREGDSDD